MKVTSNAPGKMIILGEYAVLEGAPAIVAAVNRYARVKIEPNDDQFYLISAPTLDIQKLAFSVSRNKRLIFDQNISRNTEAKLLFFNKVFAFLHSNFFKKKLLIPFCHVSINTNDFFNRNKKYKIGLGSSAAMTVALITALCKYIKKEIGEIDSLLDLALAAHFFAQGSMGSGIDIASACFRGVIKYQIPDGNPLHERNIEPLTLPENLHLIPIWTGRSTSTRQMLHSIVELKHKNSLLYENIINSFTYYANSGYQAICKNDSNKFLEIISEFCKTQMDLGKAAKIEILSEDHKQISKIVHAAGGVYKPSGAGGGDIGIAFCNSIDIQRNIQKKIDKTAYKYIKLDIIH